MLLPYRAKNPPERFPVATISLIVLNTLIFALTSDYFIVARREAVESYAASHNGVLSEPWRLLTAMFLHGNIEHLAGNMLFLWIFGASVEGRLRPFKFLVVYLLAGLTGGLLEDIFWGTLHPTVFSLGASGAIMGVAGAYLYMFAYSTICIFYWLWFFWRGVWEVQARWVVLFYVGLDVLFAFLFQGGDGVGHLAHLGGFGTGLLLVWAMRARRDTEEVSMVQATRAEVKDYSLLDVYQLETLTQHPTEDMNLILTYCEKATAAGQNRYEMCLSLLNRYSRDLIEKGDPNRLAYVLLYIPPSAGAMPAVFYLRLASRLERIASNDLACQIYRRLYDLNPQAPDTEVALYRLGQIMEHAFNNRAYAQAVYTELLRLFPNGEMSLPARRALQQM